MKKWIVPAALSWICMGFCNLFAKLASDRLPTTSVAVWWTVGYVPLTLALIAVSGMPREFDRRSVVYSFSAGVIGQIAALAFYIALSQGMVSLISTISYLYPLVTLAIACVFLKERMKARQITGVLMACLAIGLLSW